MTPDSASPRRPFELPALIDRYRLLDCLGEGGMGMVHRAFDTRTSRIVALKTPRPGIPVEASGLLREAATLRLISHPGIVPLLRAGLWRGIPWLAMELLEGRNLFEEMQSRAGESRSTGNPSQQSTRLDLVPPRREGEIGSSSDASSPRRTGHRAATRLALADASAVVSGLSSSLDHIHDLGYVHRDLKPANVFIHRAGARIAAVTLLDFGLARRATVGDLGQARSVCAGTMRYAAPEQIMGDPVDRRTDIYSLGCILYEMLTGVPPCDGDSDHEVARQQLHLEPVAPSVLNADLPWQLEDLVMQMLSKKPPARPSTAGAVATRLAQAVERFAVEEQAERTAVQGFAA